MDGQTSISQPTNETPLAKPVEEIPVNQPQQNPPNLPEEKHSPLSNGTRKRLFEILFVIIILILLFGALNYFNILRLSELFPNYLGFLPHKEVSNGTSQSNTITVSPTTIPTVSPTDQRGYSLVLSQAKQTLVAFLPTILSPSLLPTTSDITITQTKGIKESFSITWDTRQGTPSGILVISPDEKNIVQSYISFLKPESTSPSSELAKVITSRFFSIQPQGKWGCKPLYTTTYCESFWEENDGTKIGLGIQGLFTQGPNLIDNSPVVMIFFCQNSKESRLYSWKSCSLEFAQTGVAQ